MIDKIQRIKKILFWEGDWPLRCSLSSNEIVEISQILDELEDYFYGKEERDN